MDGRTVYRTESDDEGMDPWEKKNKRQMRALVNKFRSYTEQANIKMRRSSLTIPQVKLDSTQQRDRHAGLYSPECTVTYSHLPHHTSTTSTPPWKVNAKPKYKSGSRSPIFDDDNRWSPMQDEDREVYNIVYGRDNKRHGNRNSPRPRIETSDSPRMNRDENMSPLYSRSDSPCRKRDDNMSHSFSSLETSSGKRHMNRSPFYSKHETPSGHRHISRETFHSSLDSPSKKRNEGKPPFTLESSSSSNRYGDMNHASPRKDFSRGKMQGDNNSLYNRLDSPILNNQDENRLYQSPPSMRSKSKTSPYSRLDSPSSPRHGDRSPLYPRVDFSRRSDNKSPCSNSSLSAGIRSRDIHGVTSNSRISAFSRNTDVRHSNTAPKDKINTERKSSALLDVPPPSVNLSPLLSPPPPPILSVPISSPSIFRPTDYSKPLPFKSSVSIEVEKSYYLLEKLKKKQQVLSKCELKIGELYRKKSKLSNAPALFYHESKKSVETISTVSPLISAQRAALTFNGSKSKPKIIESTDRQESNQADLVLLDPVKDVQKLEASPLKESVEISSYLLHTTTSSVHHQTSTIQKETLLEQSYILQPDSKSYDCSYPSSSSHLSGYTDSYASGVEVSKELPIPSILESGPNPIFDMSHEPVRSSHPSDVNVNQVTNIESTQLSDPSLGYSYGQEQYPPSWDTSELINSGYGWPKYNRTFSPHHSTQNKLPSTSSFGFPSNAYLEERPTPYQRPQTKPQITLNLLPRADSYPSSSTASSSEDKTYVARVEEFLAKVQGSAELHGKGSRMEKSSSSVFSKERSSSKDDDDVIYVGKLNKYSSKSRKTKKLHRSKSPIRDRNSSENDSTKLRPPGTSNSPCSLHSEPPAKKFHHEFTQQRSGNNIMVNPSANIVPKLIQCATTINLTPNFRERNKMNQGIIKKEDLSNTSRTALDESNKTKHDNNKSKEILTNKINDISRKASDHKAIESPGRNEKLETFSDNSQDENKFLDNLTHKDSEICVKVVPDTDIKLSHFNRVFFKGNPIARDLKEIQQRDIRLKKVFINTQRKRTINKNLCIKNELLCLDNDKLGIRIVASTVECDIIYYIHCLLSHVNDNLSSLIKMHFTPIKELSEKIKSALKFCELCSKKNSNSFETTTKDDKTVPINDQSIKESSEPSTSLNPENKLKENPKILDSSNEKSEDQIKQADNKIIDEVKLNEIQSSHKSYVESKSKKFRTQNKNLLGSPGILKSKESMTQEKNLLGLPGLSNSKKLMTQEQILQGPTDISKSNESMSQDQSLQGLPDISKSKESMSRDQSSPVPPSILKSTYIKLDPCQSAADKVEMREHPQASNSIKPNEPSCSTGIFESQIEKPESSETQQKRNIRQEVTSSLTKETLQLKQRPPILAPGEIAQSPYSDSTVETNPIKLVKEIQSKSKHISHIISRINDPNHRNVYFLKNDMLLKKCIVDGKSVLKILIPEDKRDEIIYVVHTKFSNHGSCSNVLSILKKHFSPAPDLLQLVNKNIHCCSLCYNKQ